MKKTKMLLAFVLALAMLFSVVLTACTPEEPAEPTECTHEWGEWRTLQEATCISVGLNVRTCGLCEEEEEKPIPALGHNYDSDTGICSLCGASKNSFPNHLTYGEDYVALYEVYGSDISIADVHSDERGAFIQKKPRVQNGEGEWEEDSSKDAQKYYLGLDFLSMAMVYNCDVPTGSETYKTPDDVYAMWWRYFIERWNALLPEIPLYSNEYYDLYNTKLTGVEGHYATNPYWGVSSAIIGWRSTDNKAIIGNSTEPTGKFRYASFGASSPNAADNDMANLISGLGTVTTNAEGGYQWNEETVVKSHDEKLNADGTKTYTIEIFDDLKLSDGSAVNVDNYLVFLLAFSSPVAVEAAGRDHKAGLSYVGYSEFAKYNGSNATEEGVSKSFKGVKKLSDYKFEVTVTEDYANYFYGVAQAGFSPESIELWLGEGNSVQYDAEGHPYLSDGFYEKSGESYKVAAHIKAAAANTDTTYPYSGAYVVKSFDKATKTATLELNPHFKGDVYGTKPSIQTITYKYIVTATQLADFKAGNLDFIAGITGGADTDAAVKYADEESNGKAAYIHYGRAGYGKLGFRADFGPTQFTAVRQALACCIDRAQFALDFNGGYGGKVDGPYYAGSWMYKQAVEYGMELDLYTPDVDTAKALLVSDGWIYAADGSEYASGVRYKLIDGAEMSANDVTFRAKDGSVATVPVVATKDASGKVTSIKVAGEGDKVNAYLMPLVINWFGTQDNDFTTYVISYVASGTSLAAQAGFKVCYQVGDFSPMLDELYQAPVYGFYQGTPMYNMFNFATGFNSAAYDFAYNCTIDPAMYDDYSQWYLKDTFDVYNIAK